MMKYETSFAFEISRIVNPWGAKLLISLLKLVASVVKFSQSSIYWNYFRFLMIEKLIN